MNPEYNDEVMQKTAGISLDKLKMSPRLYNCLRRAGFDSLQDVMKTQMEEFTKLRNFGRMCADELMSLRTFVLTSSRKQLLEHYYGNVFRSDSTNTQLYKESGVKVIDIALTGNIDIEKVVFKNYFDSFCYDIDIEDLAFSVRTERVLKENNLVSLREVSALPYYSLISFDGFGQKSIIEVLDVIRQRAILQKKQNFIDFPEELNSHIKEIVTPIIGNSISLDTENEIKGAVCLQFEGRDLVSLSDEQIAEALFCCTSVKKYICKNIWPLVPEEVYNGIDKEVFLDAINDYNPCLTRVFHLVVDDLIKNKQLRVVDGKICRYKLFLSEWIETLDEDKKDIVKLKCQGLTLEEIGQEYGLTRERIRQKIFKALRVRPELYEDDYSYFVERYCFSNRELSKLLSLDTFQINYLLLDHKRGIGDIQELLEDELIPEHIKDRAAAAFENSVLLIDGECVPIKRDALMLMLMKVYFSDKDCEIEEYEAFYMDFLREHRLDDRKNLLFPNSRALEARLSDCTSVVMKGGHRFRYYDLDSIDVNELLSLLNISMYNNLEISTLKLYRDNPDVMERYDVRDEYELHNIIRKKSSDITISKIDILRMPFISVGKSNRDKQVEDLLLQMTPVSNLALAEEYEQQYGVRKETAMANFFRCIDVFYHDGLFSLDQQSVSEDDFFALGNALSEDFYLWSDIIKTYNQLSKKPNPEAINAMTLKQLGFKVYSQYVVRATYSSAENYFSQYLMKKKSVDVRDLPGEFRYIQTFYAALTNLRDSYELIEVSKDVYYRFDYFCEEYSVGDKETLFSWADSIVSKINSEYFAVEELVGSDFVVACSSLLRNPYILNSVLRVHPDIKTGRIANIYIGTRKEKDLSLLGLVTHIVQNYGEIEISKLISLLKEEYGLNFERSRILYIVEKSNEIVYDEIFDYLCMRTGWREYGDCIYLDQTRLASIIEENRGMIEASHMTIERTYWEEKYSAFVDYCVIHDFREMKDVLKIDFRELYESISQLGLSKGTIAGIVEVFLRWTTGLEEDDNISTEGSILDLFFK